MHRAFRNQEYISNPDRTADEAAEEIRNGLDVLKGIEKPLIGIFGSHTVGQDHPYYTHCQQAAKLLAEHGFGVVTGGGPGIMEAANRGAKEGGMPSVGIKASLLSGEQVSQDVHTHVIDCMYMFVRRFLLSIKADALVFFPGGYGTLNELFEYVVLIQTGLLERVPVICVDLEYWQGMRQWIENKLEVEHMVIGHDKQLIHYVDEPQEIIDILTQ